MTDYQPEPGSFEHQWLEMHKRYIEFEEAAIIPVGYKLLDLWDKTRRELTDAVRAVTRARES